MTVTSCRCSTVALKIDGQWQTIAMTRDWLFGDDDYSCACSGALEVGSLAQAVRDELMFSHIQDMAIDLRFDAGGLDGTDYKIKSVVVTKVNMDLCEMDEGIFLFYDFEVETA